jgi:hypothetical protein
MTDAAGAGAGAAAAGATGGAAGAGAGEVAVGAAAEDTVIRILLKFYTIPVLQWFCDSMMTIMPKI